VSLSVLSFLIATFAFEYHVFFFFPVVLHFPLQFKFKFKFFLLVATNIRAQAEFNPRVFHGVVAAPDASVYRRRKSPVTGLPLPQQRGGRE
jgi:hypothetical protein